MSDEEIADLLADVGISPKGRRQALLSKLEQAVRDGLIAFGDEEDEEPTQIEEEVVDNGVQEEEKEEEVIEIAGSEERIAKVEELYERYLTDYEEGEISDKDVQDFLKDYYNEGAEYSEIVETYTNEEMAEHYALIHAQLVDDEGEEYDWGEPYIVDDEYWCSGKPMKMLDENTLYDEVTGEQFSLE
jgi:predicted transcriptional regulator